MAPQPCSKCGEVTASVQIDAKGKISLVICPPCWEIWKKSPIRQAILSTLDNYFKPPPPPETDQERELRIYNSLEISKRRKGMRRE